MRYAPCLLVLLAACGDSSPEFVDAAIDAPAIDAAVDAPTVDAPVVDTPMIDAAPDAMVDAAPDAPDVDAAVDAAPDGLVDAAVDAPVDAPVTIDHCGTISQNETWGPGIHRITCQVSVEGPTGPILTIENGAIVRFVPGFNHSINVGGNAAGSLRVDGGFQGVTITSDAATPAPGDWGFIYFGVYNVGSTFDNVVIEYGGSTSLGSSWGAITTYGGQVTIRDTIVRRSGTGGVAAYFTATLDIADTTLRDNVEHGLLMTDPSSNIVGPTTNLVITGNGLTPVRSAAEHIGDLHPSSTFTGNGDDRIEIFGGSANGSVISTSATWRRLGVPYRARNYINVGDAAVVPTLTIDPGVQIQFDGGQRLVSGAFAPGRIVAIGTATDRIVLTSSRATPTAGSWWGVFLHTNDRSSAFEYVDVRYGGGDQNGIGPNTTGAVDLYLLQGIATFTNVHVADSASNGIYAYWQNEPVLTNVTYANIAGVNYVHQP